MGAISQSKRNMILSGGIVKSLLIFCVPLMIINILAMLYNTVDTVVVGQYLGKDALSAVGQVGSIYSLINGFLSGFASGAGIIIANIIGTGDKERSDIACNTSLFTATIVGLVGSVLGMACTPLLIDVINMDSSIRSMGNEYLVVLLGTTVFSMIAMIYAQIMRSYGETILPLVYYVIGLVINLVLDIVFVGVLNTGVVGAAIATLIAIVVKVMLMSIHVFTTKRDYRLNIKLVLHPDKMYFGEILAKGLPIGLQSSMFQIANIYVIRIINSIPGGTAVSAGWTVNSKFENIFFSPIGTMADGVAVFVSQNLGAKNYDRAIQCCKKGAIIQCIATMVMSVVCCALATPLIHIFSEDASVTHYALRALWVVTPFYAFFSLQNMACGVIKASGDTVRPFIYSLGSILIGRVVWLSIVPIFWNTIECVALSYPISWLTAAIVSCAYWWSGRWLKKYKREHGEENI